MEFLKQHLTPELYAQLETALKGNEYEPKIVFRQAKRKMAQ
ncbi:MAG: hypothetical protein RSB09_04870 [Clostridia bacterium]